MNSALYYCDGVWISRKEIVFLWPCATWVCNAGCCRIAWQEPTPNVKSSLEHSLQDVLGKAHLREWLHWVALSRHKSSLQYRSALYLVFRLHTSLLTSARSVMCAWKMSSEKSEVELADACDFRNSKLEVPVPKPTQMSVFTVHGGILRQPLRVLTYCWQSASHSPFLCVDLIPAHSSCCRQRTLTFVCVRPCVCACAGAQC